MYKSDFFYSFSAIVNLEASKVVGEKCVFTTFDGCTLMAPEEGNSYNLEVAPGSKRIAVIKNSLDGFSYGYSYNRRVIMDDGSLEDQCIEEGSKNQRGGAPIY